MKTIHWKGRRHSHRHGSIRREFKFKIFIFVFCLMNSNEISHRQISNSFALCHTLRIDSTKRRLNEKNNSNLTNCSAQSVHYRVYGSTESVCAERKKTSGYALLPHSHTHTHISYCGVDLLIEFRLYSVVYEYVVCECDRYARGIDFACVCVWAMFIVVVVEQRCPVYSMNRTSTVSCVCLPLHRWFVHRTATVTGNYVWTHFIVLFSNGQVVCALCRVQ